MRSEKRDGIGAYSCRAKVYVEPGRRSQAVRRSISGNKCAGAPSDAPARGVLHDKGYLVFGAVVDDDGVTGEGCVGSGVTGGAGVGAGLDLDFRTRLARALPIAST